jgi:hypothetical protein
MYMRSSASRMPSVSRRSTPPAIDFFVAQDAEKRVVCVLDEREAATLGAGSSPDWHAEVENRERPRSAEDQQ